MTASANAGISLSTVLNVQVPFQLTVLCTCGNQRFISIAHGKNVKELGRVSQTEMLLNEKLPSQVCEFSAKNYSNGSLAKVENSIQTLNILWPVYQIHTNSLF